MAMQQNNPWFASTVGLAGLIVGYVLASSLHGFSTFGMLPTPDAPSAPSPVVDVPTPTPSAPSNPATVDDDPVLGEDDAPITLIEFTDYQCPFCARHYTQTHSQIVSQYVDTGKVKLVVRDFPLGFHANAQKAAEATECADDQGKFWEMHDVLFENQTAWSNLDATSAANTFKQYAGQMGVNQSEFDTCLDSGTHAQEVTSDMSDGSASGIDGTPGFWIIGPDGQSQQISGAYPFDTFKAAFDGMLE